MTMQATRIAGIALVLALAGWTGAAADGKVRVADDGKVIKLKTAHAWSLNTDDAEVDGQEREYTSALVFVARSAYQLDSFGLEGADGIRDGKFAVLIAKARQPLPLIRSALRLANQSR